MYRIVRDRSSSDIPQGHNHQDNGDNYLISSSSNIFLRISLLDLALFLLLLKLNIARLIAHPSEIEKSYWSHSKGELPSHNRPWREYSGVSRTAFIVYSVCMCMWCVCVCAPHVNVVARYSFVWQLAVPRWRENNVVTALVQGGCKYRPDDIDDPVGFSAKSALRRAMAKSVLSSDTLPKAGRVNEGRTLVLYLSRHKDAFCHKVRSFYARRM